MRTWKKQDEEKKAAAAAAAAKPSAHVVFQRTSGPPGPAGGAQRTSGPPGPAGGAQHGWAALPPGIKPGCCPVTNEKFNFNNIDEHIDTDDDDEQLAHDAICNLDATPTTTTKEPTPQDSTTVTSDSSTSKPHAANAKRRFPTEQKESLTCYP